MPGARRSPGRQARDPADHSRRPNRRVAVEGVRAAVADQPLRIALLDAITGGRLDAPRAQGPDLAPPSYFDFPTLCALAYGRIGATSSSLAPSTGAPDRSC